MEYAAVHAEGTTILAHHLPPEIQEARHLMASARTDTAPAPAPTPAIMQRYYRVPVQQKEHEKEMILQALQETGGNKAEAARKLGMSRTTLWKKLKQYGIDTVAQ